MVPPASCEHADRGTPGPGKRKLGTLNGQMLIPDDFDTMYAEEIQRMFYGSDDEAEEAE